MREPRTYDVPHSEALDNSRLPSEACLVIGSDLMLLVSPDHDEDSTTGIYAFNGDGYEIAKLALVPKLLDATLGAVVAQAAQTARMLWPDRVITSHGMPAD